MLKLKADLEKRKWRKSWIQTSDPAEWLTKHSCSYLLNSILCSFLHHKVKCCFRRRVTTPTENKRLKQRPQTQMVCWFYRVVGGTLQRSGTKRFYCKANSQTDGEHTASRRGNQTQQSLCSYKSCGSIKDKPTGDSVHLEQKAFGFSSVWVSCRLGLSLKHILLDDKLSQKLLWETIILSFWAPFFSNYNDKDHNNTSTPFKRSVHFISKEYLTLDLKCEEE